MTLLDKFHEVKMDSYVFKLSNGGNQVVQYPPISLKKLLGEVRDNKSLP